MARTGEGAGVFKRRLSCTACVSDCLRTCLCARVCVCVRAHRRSLVLSRRHRPWSLRKGRQMRKTTSQLLLLGGEQVRSPPASLPPEARICNALLRFFFFCCCGLCCPALLSREWGVLCCSNALRPWQCAHDPRRPPSSLLFRPFSIHLCAAPVCARELLLVPSRRKLSRRTRAACGLTYTTRQRKQTTRRSHLDLARRSPWT